MYKLEQILCMKLILVSQWLLADNLYEQVEQLWIPRVAKECFAE